MFRRAAVATDSVILRSVKPSVNKAKKRTSKVKRFFSGALTVMVVALGLTFGGFGPTSGTSPAAAFDIFNPCGNPASTTHPGREAWPGGTSSFLNPGAMLTAIPADKWVDGGYASNGNSTAYEWYGTAGMGLYDGTWQEIDSDGCLLLNQMSNAISGSIHNVNMWIGEIALSVVGWAMNINFSETFLTGDGAPIPLIINGIYDKLYLEFLSPLFLLGAAYIGWQGMVKRRASVAVQGTAWMVFSAAMAIVFFSFPVQIAKTVDDAVTFAGTTIVDAATGITQPGKGTLCTLNDNAESRGQRTAQCAMWQTFIYTPWAAAQFGEASKVKASGQTISFRNMSNPPLPLLYLDARVVNKNEVAKVQAPWIRANKDLPADKQAPAPTIDTKVDSASQKKWDAFATVMKSDAAVAGWNNFSGSDSGARFQVALTNFFGIVIGILPVAFLSLTLIFQQVMFLILLVFAPIMFLAGIHPGIGRRMFLGWVEMVAGTALKRVISYAAIAVLLAVIGAVTASAAEGGFFTQVFLVAAAGLGVLAYRKRIITQYGNVNLGGGGNMGTGEGKQMLRNLGGMATGSIKGMAGANDEGKSKFAGAVKGAYKGRKDSPDVKGATKALKEMPRAEDRRLAEEDRYMNKSKGSAAQWKQWSERNGGRAVPRPRDAELASELTALGVPMRDQDGGEALAGIDGRGRRGNGRGGDVRRPDEEESGFDSADVDVPVPVVVTPAVGDFTDNGTVRNTSSSVIAVPGASGVYNVRPGEAFPADVDNAIARAIVDARIQSETQSANDLFGGPSDVPVAPGVPVRPSTQQNPFETTTFTPDAEIPLPPTGGPRRPGDSKWAKVNKINQNRKNSGGDKGARRPSSEDDLF